MPFSVLIPVGPDPMEIPRCADLFQALATFEGKGLARVVLIDDGLEPRKELTESAERFGLPVDHLVNPRKGRGCGWGGGVERGRAFRVGSFGPAPAG